MATTVDELVVQIRAETKGLREGLDQVKKNLDGLEKKTGQSLISFKALGSVLGAIGLAKISSDFLSTTRQFEDLQAVLRATTGSAETAGVAFDLIRKFTAGTTFQLAEVSGAFQTLLNAGITPTSDVLQDFGNVAAAFNKDITTLAQAAFNATTGEMEMLKQFGIIARKEGDNLKVTFDGTTKTIKADGKEIIDFIRSVGAEKFPTALEDSANTLSGRISNLQDTVSEFFLAIGDAGLREALTDLVAGSIDTLNALRPLATVIGGVLASSLRVAIGLFSGLGTAIEIMLPSILVFFGVQMVTRIIVFAKGITIAATAVRGLALAMLALGKKNIVGILAGLAVLGANAAGAFDDIKEKIREAAPELQKFVEQTLGLQLGTEESTAALEELDKALESMTSELGDSVTVPAASAADAMDSLRDAIQRTVNSFSVDLVDGLLNGVSALQSFKNMAIQIIKQIIAAFLQLVFINKILSVLLPNVFGQGAAMELPTMTMGEFFKRSSGGAMRGRTPYIVGERGPEMFIPHTAGTMRNAHDSRSLMGSGASVVVNQNLNFSTGVVQTVRTEVTRMLPQIASVTQASVLEGVQRGGNFRKGMHGA